MLMFVDKKAILNLRLKPEVRDEFAIAAELRGASMSGLLHQFIVRTIREEKEHSPQSFRKDEHPANEINSRGGVVAHIGPANSRQQSKDEVREQYLGDDKIKPPQYVRHLGKLSDETAKPKQKTIRKKAGGRR